VLSAKAIREVDADKDKTIDKNEYNALVEKRFKAADKDGDGTLDKKELNSSAGRALLRLLQ
jgi:Ca2+-binding EF-hand superfamily protein